MFDGRHIFGLEGLGQAQELHCDDDTFCEEGYYCSFQDDDTCQPTRKVDEACALDRLHSSCDAGLLCHPEKVTCRPQAEVMQWMIDNQKTQTGNPCKKHSECAWPVTYCDPVSLTCQSLKPTGVFSKEGEVCFPTVRDCDEGLRCDLSTATCKKKQITVGPTPKPKPGPDKEKPDLGFLEGQIWGLPKIAVYGAGAVALLYLFTRKDGKSTKSPKGKTTKG